MLKKFWPQAILFFLVLSIVLTNYSPNTWLSGWDNLHPEFDFLLNIKRSIFAVWQEYQGLGLLGGMGHAADLPRQVFLWLTSFILPISFIRYFYHFLMLFIGVFGTFYLARDFFLRRFEKIIRTTSSLLAAFFYILNLGTIQYFYVPFEPYSTFWGMLPWELFVLLKYLENPSRKNLIFLTLVNLVAAPQGYVQTIFLVYLIYIALFLLAHIIKNRSLYSIISSLKIAFVIFSINSFWLLPTFYFMKNSFSVNRNAMQNYMATDKFFEMNKIRGSIDNFIYLKEFYYDFVDYNYETDNFDYMMKEWRKQFSDTSVYALGFILFLFISVGLFKRNKYSFELSLLFLISCIFFLSNTFFFSSVNGLLRQFPINDQLFRNPFTKFITPTVLTISLLFGLGTSAFSELVKKFSKTNIVLIGIPISLIIVLIYIFNPVWKGYFIYKNVRLKIPDEYFSVFNYFGKQNDKGRIANFPQTNIWGWTYYLWGTTGSGFSWYGIENPIIDRTFDVWSSGNENYYWEISQAIYSRNQKLFENLLEKYQIRWLLVDDNVLTYFSAKALYLNQLKEILDYSTKVKLVSSFGKITIYQVELESKPKDFVFLAKDLPVVNSYKWNNFDQAYEEYGTYVTESQKSKVKSQKYNSNIYYPFRSLFTSRRQEELEFGVEDKGDYFSFMTKIPTDLVGGKLAIPEIKIEEVSEIDSSDQSKVNFKYSEVYLDGEFIEVGPPERSDLPKEISLPYIREGNLEIRVPKISGYYSYDLNPKSEIRNPKSCDQFNQGTYKHDFINEGGKELLRLTSVGSSNCLDFDLPNLTQRLGYLITVENRNVEGKSLLFAVINKNSQRADLETYLPKIQITNNKQQITKSYFIQPPMEQFATGYTLHLDNISIGRVKTVNDLGRITVNPIPYRFLTGLKVVKNQALGIRQQALDSSQLEVSHPNPSFYQVSINNETMGQFSNLTLVLSQSFDNYWKAYQISNFLGKWFPFWFGQELKDHVLVNNWQNGWRLQLTTDNLQPTTIILVYLPQYLEYLGFGLLLIIPLIIFKMAGESKKVFNSA